MTASLMVVLEGHGEVRACGTLPVLRLRVPALRSLAQLLVRRGDLVAEAEAVSRQGSTSLTLTVRCHARQLLGQWQRR